MSNQQISYKSSQSEVTENAFIKQNRAKAMQQAMKKQVTKKFGAVERQLRKKKKFISNYDEVTNGNDQSIEEFQSNTISKEDGVRTSDTMSNEDGVRTRDTKSCKKGTVGANLKLKHGTLKEQLVNKVFKVGSNIQRVRNTINGYHHVDGRVSENELDKSVMGKCAPDGDIIPTNDNVELDENSNSLKGGEQHRSKSKTSKLQTLSSDMKNYCTDTYISLRDFIQNRDDYKSSKSKLLDESQVD